jgi:hypothetical protein
MHPNPSANRKKLITSHSADPLPCKNSAAIDWPDMIHQWESSGVPQKEFCHQRAINYNAFVFQRMQLKKAQHAKSAATPRLLPVTPVAEPVNPPSTQVGFVVHWPNGMRLCVPPHAEGVTLRALLSQLRG